MSSLADYLAKNYLTADPQPAKKSKKRKRTAADLASTGLVIADDDSTGWDTSSRRKNDERDDTRAASLAAGRTADFRKKKTSGWQSLASETGPAEDDADAILRSAAAENAAREAAEAAEEEDAAMAIDAPKKGGLQTADEVKREAERKRRAERRRIEEDVRSGAAGAAQETIYRDASGRRIDVALKRAEARKKAEEEERKKRQEEDEARGDVQLAMREERRRELEEAKYMTLARTADDVEMNEEMREVQRWNDPAAGFLTKKPSRTSGKAAVSRGPSKPTYQGAFDPNRYGIRPGSRWDGVDRGNGFEKKWFAARNRQRDTKALEYQWEMDE